MIATLFAIIGILAYISIALFIYINQDDVFSTYRQSRSNKAD